MQAHTLTHTYTCLSLFVKAGGSMTFTHCESCKPRRINSKDFWQQTHLYSRALETVLWNQTLSLQQHHSDNIGIFALQQYFYIMHTPPLKRVALCSVCANRFRIFINKTVVHVRLRQHFLSRLPSYARHCTQCCWQTLKQHIGLMWLLTYSVTVSLWVQSSCKTIQLCVHSNGALYAIQRSHFNVN